MTIETTGAINLFRIVLEEIAGSQRRVQELEAQLSASNVQNADLTLKLNALRQSAHAATDDMAGEVLTLRAENEVLRNELKTAQTVAETLWNDLTT